MRKVLNKFKKQERATLLVNIALAHKNLNLAWLTDAIGMDATLQLILAYGGERIHLPKAEDLLSALNSASAALEVHEGKKTPSQAAKHYSVSTQSVNKVLRTIEKYEEQLADARRVVGNEMRRKT